MSEYLFVFGRTPLLACAELSSLYHSAHLVSPHTAVVADDTVDPQKLIDLLGGTVKIATGIRIVKSLTAQDIADFLAKHSTKQITFGISGYDGVGVSTKLLAQIKMLLEGMGRRARFVAGRDGELSSVVVAKQQVAEIVAAPTKEGVYLGQTVAVQPFEAWNRRDYGRPFADPKAGMLPPKVARMMVNMALGSDLKVFEGLTPRERVLLDPFCGMGTILAEALLTGWHVVGSDQSKEVVEKAQKNLEWLMTRTILVRKQGSSLPSWQLCVSDATHVSEQLKPDSVNAIVTEPFLGDSDIKNQISNLPAGKAGIKNTNQKVKIENTIKGLEKLYIGCFKDWQRVLKQGGRVVIVLPEYYFEGKTYFVKRVIDRCENLGYTNILGPIEYSRPQAIVRRKIFVFQKR